VLGQGLEIGRKVQLASRTLADLASQQLPANSGATVKGNCPAKGAANADKPCVADEDLAEFWAGAQMALTPFNPSNTDPSSVKATISLVIFDNVTNTSANTSGCCRARVVWSAGFGASPTLRACGPLTQSNNGTNGATYMPVGNYPGAAGDPTTGGTYYVASGVANTTDTYLIVADVTYTYKPKFDFRLFNWTDTSSGTGYTINQTTYMTPRNGATSPIRWQPNTTTITTYYNCPCVTSTGASCTVGTAKPTASSGNYNVP